MSKTELLMAFTAGTALLAVWSYVRWPGAAPATMRGAVIRVALALVLMQAGAAVLGSGVEALPGLTLVLVVAVVMPVLTFAFLAALWFLKLCADQVSGSM
jgi:hypothetical protein